MQSPPVITHPRRVLVLSAPGSNVLSFVKELTGSAPESCSIEPTSLAQEQPTSETLLRPPSACEPSGRTENALDVYDSLESAPVNDDLTPELQPTTTTAGLTHTLPLHTKYYKADIPIWLDETSSPAEWAADLCSEDAREVVQAIGAWIVLFTLDHADGRRDYSEDEDKRREEAIGYLKAVQDTISATHGVEEGFDGLCLAVGWPSSETSERRRGDNVEKSGLDAHDIEQWEDVCFDHGFEFVDGRKRKHGERNAMGELQGMERVREALEANDWEGGDDQDGQLEDDHELARFLGDEESPGDSIEFGNFIGGRPGSEDDKEITSGSDIRADGAELKDEFGDLKIGLRKDRERQHKQQEEVEVEEAAQVEDFERMMSQAMAAKEMSSHLPKEQRRKAAARAVNDMMRTM